MDLSFIDGHWVDVSSLVCGFLMVAEKRRRLALQPESHLYPLLSRKTSLEFGNGVAVFPLLLMVVASVSSAALQGLLASSKITLAIAGVSGAMAILEDSGN